MRKAYVWYRYGTSTHTKDSDCGAAFRTHLQGWVCMPKVCKSLAERRPLICNVKGNKALLLEEVTRPWQESRRATFPFTDIAAINTKYLEHIKMEKAGDI